MLLVMQVGAQTPTLAIADSLYAVGNYSEAILELESIQEKSDVVQVRLAKAYAASGNLDSAIKSYKRSLQDHPNK